MAGIAFLIGSFPRNTSEPAPANIVKANKILANIAFVMSFF